MSELKIFTDHLYENEKKFATLVYLRQPIDGEFQDINWKEVMLRARKMATFLKEQGLKKGDRVSILSKNCAEWFIADFAIVMAGLVSVPLFATQHKETIKYILHHSEVKLIFVGKLDDWAPQESAIDPSIIRVAFPYKNSMPATFQWNDILDKYPPQKEDYRPDFKDLYTIIYTSGTTGHPKGVMISFQNIAAYLAAIDEEYKAGHIKFIAHNYFLSYLPLAHILERCAVEATSTLYKTTVSFVESPQTFAKNIQEVEPTIFVAVPRIWTQFKLKILSQIPQEKLDRLLKIPIISTIIKYKIKKAMGLRRSKENLSGSAHISPDLIAWYKTIGVNIIEAYGQTENLTYATLLHPKENKPGKVGRARLGLELKLGPDGEVLTKSNIIMEGYYKNPKATEEAFTEDGFLHTGDLGFIDSEGYLSILGRIKDSFKTDKGEFINPAPIENKFHTNPNIEMLCLIGQDLPQPVMIVCLSSISESKDIETLRKELQLTLDKVNKKLSNYDKISHVFVAKGHWTPENGFLTSTLKIKRNVIAEHYGDQIKQIVKGDEKIVWEQPHKAK